MELPWASSSSVFATTYAPMFESLLATIAGDISLTDEQVALIESSFVPRSFKKGHFFQRESEIATHGGFILRGCFRTYMIDATGKEAIVYFSPEGAWIGDLHSATTRTPTPYFVDAIEPSDVLLIDLPSFETLLMSIPEVARNFRLGLQRAQEAGRRRIAFSLHASAEERYLAFLEKHPSLVGRIPQHMLASYLGITPETLSRIRTRLKKH